MSEAFNILFTIAQIVYTIWPLFILVVTVYSFWGYSLRGVFRRLKKNLLITWTVLVVIWILTQFAEGPNLSIFDPYDTVIFLGGYALLLAIQLLPKFKPGRIIRDIGDAFAGQAQARLNMRQMHALHDLKNLDPYQFEHLVTELYRAEGFDARHAGKSGDHGVDVIVYTPQGEHWIVQCKRYRDSVGEETVRELYGTLHHEKAQRAVLVTSAETTLAAETWARGKPIDLIDGRTLLRWIERVAASRQPTLFDRFAAAVQAFFAPRVSFEGRVQAPQQNTSPVVTRPRPVSNGSRPKPAQPAQLQPIERRVVTVSSRDDSRPLLCPHHHVPMVPRPPRPNDRPGRVLYRCQHYPQCRVVLDPQELHLQ